MGRLNGEDEDVLMRDVDTSLVGSHDGSGTKVLRCDGGGDLRHWWQGRRCLCCGSDLLRLLLGRVFGFLSTGSEGSRGSSSPMKLLFVEMGVGYDQHGQDITVAAMRACKDAISSNSIPAFRRGSIPGVSFDQMKLHIKLGVPHSLQKSLDVEKVKSVFPYGEILNVEVVDGGLICSSGVLVEEMGDKNDDCYIVNAAVYVGY
ncbi:uncharacterized protein HKW66_Vig0039740 [Vigna angularis]|uniref:Uncharacterized protein n=1 Tax=Phaseolus angularis TaxID=3914 RepID=A0A8T0LC40_PHAAN|nr:uncharacterized protein HKW66_Vig0039740 [Vigna angularis]